MLLLGRPIADVGDDSWPGSSTTDGCAKPAAGSKRSTSGVTSRERESTRLARPEPIHAEPGRRAIRSGRWTRGASTTSPPRSRRCPITRSRRTAPTCARSPTGARAATSVRPRPVTRPIVRRYVAYLTTRRFARSTMARKAAALRRYFRWAIGIELVTADPTSGVSVRGGGGRLPRVLDQRELNGLLDAAAPEDEPDWRRRRDDAVLELLYGSGLRVGELCGLQVSSLSLATSSATVWGKGAKERRVPLSEPAVRALRRWLAVRADVVPSECGDVLFGNERGHALTTATCAGSSIDDHPARPIRTPFATRSPRTSSMAAPICEPSKSCSATATWPRRSATPTSAASGCRPPIARPTPEHEHRSRRRRPPDAVDAVAEPPQPRGPRAPHRPLLAVGQVRRRPRRRRSAVECRPWRPRQFGRVRPDRRDRTVRSWTGA